MELELLCAALLFAKEMGELEQKKINLKSLQSKYLGSDTISRLKVGKTLFGNQLPHIGSDNSTFCNTYMVGRVGNLMEEL